MNTLGSNGHASQDRHEKNERWLNLLVLGINGTGALDAALSGARIELTRVDPAVDDAELNAADAVLIDTSRHGGKEGTTFLQRVLDLGIPAVLINNDDAGAVAAALGIGIRTEALVVKPVRGAREVLVVDVGNGATGEPVNWGISERGLENPPSARQSASGEQPPQGAGNAPELNKHRPELRTPAAIADRIAEHVASRHLLPRQQGLLKRAVGEIPPEVPHRIYYLETEIAWSPGSNQTCDLGVTWQVELYGSQNPPNKFLRITPRGYGASPGTLFSDTRWERGWYQEKVAIDVRAASQFSKSVSLLEHSPPNTNGQTALESSTSFDVGFSQADGVSATFTASKSVSTTISDFQVVNMSKPDHAVWENMLALVGGDTPYEKWEDLVKIYFPVWGGIQLLSLPGLAKQLFSYNCQAVWIASNTLKEQIPFGALVFQRMRYTWVKTEGSVTWSSAFREQAVGYHADDNPLIIDFSLV